MTTIWHKYDEQHQHANKTKTHHARGRRQNRAPRCSVLAARGLVAVRLAGELVRRRSAAARAAVHAAGEGRVGHGLSDGPLAAADLRARARFL